MPTALQRIEADHRLVESLFERFADTGDASYAGQIFDALSAHDEVEQHALYPTAMAVLDDAELVAEALASHSVVKELIDHARSQEGRPLVATMELLRAAVSEHVATEEQVLLPRLAAQADDAVLDALASRLEQIKQRVG